jgi:HAD superfamily hydrolase (TIGR01509 family)
MEPGKALQDWRPAGVVFDLDGLVLDSERIYCRAWQQAAGELGFFLTEEVYAQFVGISNNEAERLLAESMGAGFPVEKFAVLWHRHWEAISRQERIPSKPGFEELMVLLQDDKVPRAIATSSDGPDVLHSLGERAAYFSAIVSRDQVRYGKPAPDLYLEAASRLGLEPGACLALEDSEVGMHSACAAGMAVILVPDMKQPSAEAYQQAFRVCSSLHEVREWWKGNRLHPEGDSKTNRARLPQNK